MTKQPVTVEHLNLAREVRESLVRFGHGSAFHGLGDRHRAVAAKYRELQSMFPEVATVATAFSDEETVTAEREELSDFETAVFDSLCSLQDLYDAEGLFHVYNSYEAAQSDAANLVFLAEAFSNPAFLPKAENKMNQ